MPNPTRQDPILPAPFPGDKNPGTRDDAPESYLNVVPVGPHRLFAHWRLTPDLRRRTERTVTRPAAPGNLLIRVFRLDHGNDDLERAHATENFPVDESRAAAYFSVAYPGGFVAAVLGMQDCSGRFFPLLRAPRIALPEAPERPAPPPRPDASLNEAAIVGGADSPDLPPELRRIPEEPALRHAQTASAAIPEASGIGVAVPNTPALDESGVISAALASPPDSAAPREDPRSSTRPAGGAAACPVPLSSAHLSGGSEEEAGAPLTLRATLVIEGRLRSGDRLWIERVEPARRPGGHFVWTRPIGDFLTAWNLLRETARERPIPSVPPPASEPRQTQLPIRFSVEIEGAVRDPAYLARLPREISVDAAGRFSLIQSISPRHPAVPEWKLDRRRAPGARST